MREQYGQQTNSFEAVDLECSSAATAWNLCKKVMLKVIEEEGVINILITYQ
jgi:hypothetical protein